MKKRMIVFLAVVGLMALLLSTTVFYQVNYNQLALVKTFGKASAPVTDAGPHFKWPWPIQRVVHYDTNTHVLEDALNQIKLRDNQHILLTLYCAWKIKDAQKFDVNFDTVGRGEEAIRRLLETFTGSVAGGYAMDDLVNTDPGKMKLNDLERKVEDQLKARAAQDYGVEIVMVGTKSLGVTEGVAAAVIDAQKAERKRDMDAYKSEGETIAQVIREQAKAESRQIIAFADRKAELIRAEGVLSVAKMYDKFKDAPQLSIFLRSLDSLKKELQNRTVMLLDIKDLPALKMFVNGPAGDLAPTSQPAAAPGAAAQK